MAHLKLLYYDQGAAEDKSALRYLKSLLGDREVTISLIYITEELGDVENEKRRDLAKEQRNQQDRLKKDKALQAAKEIFEPLMLNMEILTLEKEGDPVEKVQREIERGDYDFLSLAAFGRGAFAKDVLGAHAKPLVKNSKIPTLIHKGKLEECEKVLIHVPNDKDRCLRFIRFMVDLLEGSRPSVTFLSIIENGHHKFEGYTSAEDRKLTEALGDYDREELKYLKIAQRILEERDFEAEIRYRIGDLVTELLNEAKEGRYDLMAFAPEKPGMLMNLWQGDESFEIMRDIEISALKFPTPKEE